MRCSGGTAGALFRFSASAHLGHKPRFAETLTRGSMLVFRVARREVVERGEYGEDGRRNRFNLTSRNENMKSVALEYTDFLSFAA